MAWSEKFLEKEPVREVLDAHPGVVLLEFGAPWCPHCQAAAPLVQEALTSTPQVAHLRVEDGSGRRLGRSYRVKLWPTLIFLKEGAEVARLVRPADVSAIRDALQKIA